MTLWDDLPAAAQDGALLALGLLPLALLALALLPGHRPAPLVAALLRRHRGISAILVALVAISVAVGTGLLAAERAVRAASARAADLFDVVIAAPGSETTVLLAAAFLQPADMGLVSGEDLAAILDDPRAAMAAPLGFGDSVGAFPVIGTTADLVRHLAPGLEGPLWRTPFEAVVGAATPFAPGDGIEPAHGHGDAAEDSHDADLAVVARMPRTGTPWDRAVLIPIEGVWRLHGLSDGHAPGSTGLGPPFDPALTPGAPAVVVRATGIGPAYSLRADWQRDGETMALLPGATLAQLFRVMGDVREAMSLMALVSLGLVAAAVLCGLALVARLFRPQIALLHALGAPARFSAAVLWLHAVLHLLAGAAMGLGLGWLAAGLASRAALARAGLDVSARIGMPELIVLSAFLGLASTAALASVLMRR